MMVTEKIKRFFPTVQFTAGDTVAKIDRTMEGFPEYGASFLYVYVSSTSKVRLAINGAPASSINTTGLLITNFAASPFGLKLENIRINKIEYVRDSTESGDVVFNMLIGFE